MVPKQVSQAPKEVFMVAIPFDINNAGEVVSWVRVVDFHRIEHDGGVINIPVIDCTPHTGDDE